MQTDDEFLNVLNWNRFEDPEFWEGESWQMMLDLLADLREF